MSQVICERDMYKCVGQGVRPERAAALLSSGDQKEQRVSPGPDSDESPGKPYNILAPGKVRQPPHLHRECHPASNHPSGLHKPPDVE